MNFQSQPLKRRVSDLNSTSHQRNMKQIAQSLVKAQKEFGPALKTSTNPHFKNRYADLSKCIDAVIDALNNNGIALIQQTHEDQSGVTVETMFLHETGESFSCGRLHVPASKHDPQGYGSALTYARRYSLMAACGIAPEDDDGNAAAKAKQAETDSQMNAIKTAQTVDMLKSHFAAAWKMSDEQTRQTIKAEYDNRLNQLTKEKV